MIYTVDCVVVVVVVVAVLMLFGVSIFFDVDFVLCGGDDDDGCDIMVTVLFVVVDGGYQCGIGGVDGGYQCGIGGVDGGYQCGIGGVDDGYQCGIGGVDGGYQGGIGGVGGGYQCGIGGVDVFFIDIMFAESFLVVDGGGPGVLRCC